MVNGGGHVESVPGLLPHLSLHEVVHALYGFPSARRLGRYDNICQDLRSVTLSQTHRSLFGVDLRFNSVPTLVITGRISMLICLTMCK